MPAIRAAEPLALHGGAPVRRQRLPYGRQALSEDDIREVVEVLRSDHLTTGPRVAEFEEAVAAYVGSREAVSFSSGTAALHGAMFAAGLAAGDEVITTPLTFCATANSVVYQGAIPRFADVSADTLTLDHDRVRALITGRTKAILPMDYAGHPADLDALRAVADDHGLMLIEDGCQALGAQSHGRRVGALSDMTVFSFHPVKHITTGEGGMVTTNRPEFAARLRLFRNHGLEAAGARGHDPYPWEWSMVALGYNYRLTDIGCALGRSQLRRLDETLAQRRGIAAAYSAAFDGLPGMRCPAVRPGISPAWHLYPIQLVPDALQADRAAVFAALRAEGLGVSAHHRPVHLHPYYRERFGFRGGECPVAESAYERLISLPIFPSMAADDVRDVIDAVHKVLAYYAR